MQLVDDFLRHFPNLRLDPISVEVATLGARIRATTAAPAPDALILATGVLAGAPVAIGNDPGWRGIARRAGLELDVAVLGTIA